MILKSLFETLFFQVLEIKYIDNSNKGPFPSIFPKSEYGSPPMDGYLRATYTSVRDQLRHDYLVRH